MDPQVYKKIRELLDAALDQQRNIAELLGDAARIAMCHSTAAFKDLIVLKAEADVSVSRLTRLLDSGLRDGVGFDRESEATTLEGISFLQKAGWAQRHPGDFLWWNEPGSLAPRQYKDALRMQRSTDEQIMGRMAAQGPASSCRRPRRRPGSVIEMDAYPVRDMQQWGCPKCGYRSGSSNMSMGGAAAWRCGDCGYDTIVLNDSLQATPSSWVNPTGKLAKHPREGQPSHGRPDERPPEGGEFFRSRGVGLDDVPSCFVCGVDLSGHYSTNISAFVQCKEAGERVVRDLFQGRAHLDFRKREPDYIQVKVGTCREHLPHLNELHTRSHVLGRIDSDHLSSVIRGEKARLRFTVMRLKRGDNGEPRAPGADWEPAMTTLDFDQVKYFDEGFFDHKGFGWRVDTSIESISS